MPLERIGQVLVNTSIITENQLQEALQMIQQPGSDRRIGEALIELGYVTEEGLRDAMATQAGVHTFNPQTDQVDPDVVRQANDPDKAIPISFDGNAYVVVVSDPNNLRATDDLRAKLQTEITLLLATPTDFEALSQVHFGVGTEIEASLAQDTQERRRRGEAPALGLTAKDTTTQDAESTGIIRAVQKILDGAVRMGASDVHINPRDDGAAEVLYRIDSICQTVLIIPPHQVPTVTARIKIMAGMDTSEKRKAQDGRADLLAGDKQFDLRVSMIPTVYGSETVAIRLLDKRNADIKLPDLGFDEDEMNRFAAFIKQPHGIILITGPTGSGKSTTLIAALNRLNHASRRILTVEDPVEYELRGINQIQVNLKAGLTFAVAMRSFVRQDPDIIMVGEIRDYETADLAVNAAMTGHLVFSTLHTNDAPGAIPRINNLGVPPFLINASVIGIMGQRLVRKLCPRCKHEYEPSKEELEMIERSQVTDQEGNLRRVLYRSTGCKFCNQVGYRGRIGIFEVMPVTNELRNLIMRSTAIHEVKQLARQQGMRTLWESGLGKVNKGITSLDELLRVARPDYEESVEEPVPQRRIGLLAEVPPTLAEVESFSNL
ncbi:MAG: ATPase, T2SS/T4P/T4SS family [Patescibacteria group bacterium]|jgi:type IV pilus assembly protein PilB